MAKYTLYYFDITALAEPLRYMLSYGNVDFKDVRVARDDWPALKPTMPMGQMPVLEVGGKRYHQSMAMCRYLAKQIGLAGANDLENLEIDIAADTINDMRLKIGLVSYESDPALKEKKYGPLVNETLPFYLGKLEEMVQANGGYFALGKPTWADFFFVALLDYMNYMAKFNLVEKYPGLSALAAKINGLPAVKAWLEKRPKTDM